MSSEINTSEVESIARQLLEDRIQVIRDLAKARDNSTRLRNELADAEREDTRLYANAQRVGWTIEELKKVGITEPGKRAKTTRRKSTAANPATDTEQQEDAKPVVLPPRPVADQDEKLPPLPDFKSTSTARSPYATN
ncbi:hypothetical protein [Paeniglutamicibacter sp. NPDC091659]|uniref:hypothetical protein n=1 Tax=Paeniglutamicibacter sp. NPDC091659 TaxID=3364389 RepID=UPI003830EEB7